MTVELVTALARGFVGIKETPANSNNVIFNTRYYGREVSGESYPWCAVFIWDVFRLAGAGGLYYGGGKTASCTTLMNWGRNNGLFVPGGYKRGDLVFFNWAGRKDFAEHVGIAVENPDVAAVLTVEGNTSSGSNSNGGEVQERRRDLAAVIGGYRPRYRQGGNDMTFEQFEAFMERYTQYGGTGDRHSLWADEAVAFAKSRGIFHGDGAGNYGWMKPLTREGAAQIIYNIMNGGASNLRGEKI